MKSTRRFLRTLAAVMVAALGTALLVGVAPSAAADIVASPPCADVLFIGARGSGTTGPGTPGWTPTAGDPYGLGGSVEAVRQYMLKNIASRRRVATISVEYPASGVATIPFRADVYFGGLSTGELWAESTLSARNCPGEVIVLAGFSQGAMVMHRVMRHWVAVNSPLRYRVAAAVLVGDGDRVPADNTIIYGGASSGKRGIGLNWTSQSGSSWTKFPTELRDKIIEVCEPDDLVCDQPSTSVAALATHSGYSMSSSSIRLAGAQTALRVLDVPRAGTLSFCVGVGSGVSSQVPVDVLGGATLQWRVQPGSSLPPGISLSANGTVSGARTTAGAWTTVVEVRNTIRTPASAWIPATVKFIAGCSGVGPRLAPRGTATVAGSMRQEDRATWTFPVTNTGDATWTASQVIVNVVAPSGAGYLVPCGTNVSVPAGGSWTCTAGMDLNELGTSVGTLFWQSGGLWFNQVPTSPWSLGATVNTGPLTGTGTTAAATTVTVGDFTPLTSSVRNDSSKTMTFGWIDYYVEGPDGQPVMAACLADTNITLAPGQSWTCNAGFRAGQRGTYRGWLKYRLPSGAVYNGPHLAGSDRTWVSGSIPTVFYAEPGYSTLDGKQILLHGKNLDLATGVKFGGVAGQLLSRGAPDLLFVKAPAHAAGSASIVVTGPDGASEALPFEYRGPDSPTRRASLGAGSVQANAASSSPAMSRDGVWVAFQSRASNLIAGDTNGVQDVFLRNTVTGTTIRVTDNIYRAQADGPSANADVSANGRVIAFESDATDLWPRPTTAGHVWVRLMSNSALLPVDISNTTGLGNGRAASPSIDDDGRFVAFSSSATNLVANDTRTFTKIFVRDMDPTTGPVMVEASTNASGVPANGRSTEPVISGDGKVVAFKSWATNLIPGDSVAHHPGLYVKELATGAVTRVDVSDTGEASNGTTLSAASLSTTGLVVAFSTDASNLNDFDKNGVEDVYARYVNVGRVGIHEFTWRVSMTDDLTDSPNRSYNPVVDETGNGAIAFLHDGSDLGVASGPATTQVYVHTAWNDVATLTPIGTVSTGVAGGLVMSGDGTTVAFDSDGSDLVANDTNGSRDVFVAPLPPVEGPPPAVTGVKAIPSSEHVILTWRAASVIHPVTYVARLWDSPTGGSQVATPQVLNSPYAVFDGLVDGETVYAEVTTQSNAGVSDPSTRIPVTPAAIVPETPTEVTLSPFVRLPAAPGGDGDGLWAIDVSWDEPNTSPGVDFVARAYTEPGGGVIVAAGGTGANAPKTAQLVIEAGRTAYIEVVAKNRIGESEPTAPIKVTAPPVPAWAPLEPAATATSTAATVAWHPPLYTGGAPITGYQVTASPGGRTCITTAGTSSTGPAVPTTCKVTGLTNGVTYKFAVQARTAAGLGGRSTSTAAVTPATTPSAVRNLAVTYPASRTVKVSWAAPASTGGAAVTGYRYRLRSSATSTWGAWINVGDVRSVNIAQLKLGARYYIQVAARNRVGAGPESTVQTRTIT